MMRRVSYSVFYAMRVSFVTVLLLCFTLAPLLVLFNLFNSAEDRNMAHVEKKTLLIKDLIYRLVAGVG